MTTTGVGAAAGHRGPVGVAASTAWHARRSGRAPRPRCAARRSPRRRRSCTLRGLPPIRCCQAGAGSAIGSLVVDPGPQLGQRVPDAGARRARPGPRQADQHAVRPAPRRRPYAMGDHAYARSRVTRGDGSRCRPCRRGWRSDATCLRPPPRTSGSVRYGICSASAMIVDARTMPSYADDLVDHPLQVGVGPGHDPAQQVAAAGDGVRLQHLGDVRQVRGDRSWPVPLADLQGHEAGHRRSRSPPGATSGPKPRITPARDQLVQPGLDGAPGHPQPAGHLQHADPRLLGEQRDSRASSASMTSDSHCAAIPNAST